MKNIIKINKVLVAATVAMISGADYADASLLQLSHEPLFLNQTVPPAIAVTLDDSGSMAWTYMGANDSNGFVDPTKNRLYYNPNITYSPPLRADGSSFPQSDPSNAMVDGYPNDMNARVDIRTRYIAMGNFSYSRTGNNVTISFKDTRRYNARSGSWTNQYPTGWGCDNGCTGGTQPYYYLGNTRYNITDADELKNFANWYTYYNSRAKLSKAAISRAFAGFNPSFKIAWQELNYRNSFNNLNKFEDTHRNNFFSWLFGAPTSGGTPLRASFKRAGEKFELDSSYTSDDYAGLLSCQQNFHIAISDGGWNGGLSGTFIQDDTSRSIPGDTGTPENGNQPLYGSMGYNGAGAQKIYNYSRDNYLADVAFDSWMRDLKPNLPNYVPRYKKDYTDHDNGSIDFSGLTDEWESSEFVWNPKNDPAYWQHVVTYNVGMGLNASRVEAHASGNTTTCNTVGVTDSKDAVYQSLRANSPTSCVWPNNVIDDVWHSSINSRGDFFSANDPEELINALNEVVNNITERVSRGSTSTVTSGIITDNTSAFSPSFDSSTWSGTLQAKEVNADRSFGDITWDAGCVLTGGYCDSIQENVTKQALRNIYTYDKAANSVVKFDVTLNTALKQMIQESAGQYAGLNYNNPVDGTDVNNIINYVIGDRDQEQANNGSLRTRKSVMSDIVHSSPVIVRGPGEGYKDNLWPNGSPEEGSPYLDFKISEFGRKNMVYVGSNGGMLHAFETESSSPTGHAQEVWSFIPNTVIENLAHLPTNKHHSYVDNTPVKRDVFINGSWKTILVGGLRYGGQAYYALDVTDASSTQPKVLWEFTDSDDQDLGYTYGKPEIVRISSTGEWVALLPNGYNNSQNDTNNPSDPNNHVSASGNAVMYVVRLSDGQLITKIDTGVGSSTTPNGLATPVGVDSEFVKESNLVGGNGVDIGVDLAYAGDLYGNLWRFDLSDTDPSNWTATALVKAQNVMDRPITVQPKVIAIPDSVQTQYDDIMVVFGTGKYIEIPDRDISLPAEQYMVGVIDGISSTEDNLDIMDSRFVTQSMSGNASFRSLSNNVVDYTQDYGWKLRLIDQGERVFNPMALFNSDLMLATTNVTAGVDPCLPGGKSWIVSINPLTGGTPIQGGSEIDIFRNIKIYIGGQLVSIPGSGDLISIPDFIIGEPPVLENQGGGGASIVIEGTENTNIIDLYKHTWRRRNWTNVLTQ
ncbi:pilus assembly protein [Marinicella rhabdoformis]|uniref:pilus assembly protein n=1 Tax=Marinicella rhabdoformis TaxID=2580566 RepID=UPI0012AEC644|nr:PilC/PilY family type IV pilus protein [Marinicella rhabdoformis]